MTLREKVQQMDERRFAEFCYYLYNKGWFDKSHGVDDECWVCDVMPGMDANEALEILGGVDDYTPSSTAGDYSPSNPWDAPGMSVHDFI